MKNLDVLAAVLVVVGALNWGAVGIAHVDLVALLFGMRFGETSGLTSAVYSLVGLAGIYQAIFWRESSSAGRDIHPPQARHNRNQPLRHNLGIAGERYDK